MTEKEEIYQILAQFNIFERIKIEDEAVDYLLSALKSNPTRVYLDNENALMIELD